MADLVRLWSCDEGTPGILYVGGFTFSTIELPWNNNRKGKSCIRTGRYLCEYENHPEKGPCYRVNRVKGRDGILIHVGNWAGDTGHGFASDSEGCILIGKTICDMAPKGKKDQLAVTASRKSMAEFLSITEKKDFYLQIHEICDAESKSEWIVARNHRD